MTTRPAALLLRHPGADDVTDENGCRIEYLLLGLCMYCKRLGEPWIISTVTGVGYRIDMGPDTTNESGDRG